MSCCAVQFVGRWRVESDPAVTPRTFEDSDVPVTNPDLDQLLQVRPSRKAPVGILTSTYGARVLEPLLRRLDRTDVRLVPVENEFLASMIAWEKAPILPIFQWFSPELRLPSPDRLNDDELHEALWNTIHKLFEKRIVLDFTDHLTDRELYTLIWRDILPSAEKKIDNSSSYLHWDCSDASGDAELWLRYYASPEEREQWDEELNMPMPPHEEPPYPRNLPRAPF